MKAQCGIYEDRPPVCRDYPKIDHWMPDICTYTFPGGGDGPREGDCSCGVGACCAVPREGGEPGGNPLHAMAGGEPCKHLEWTEDEEEGTEKVANEMEKVADSTSSGLRHLLPVLGQ